MSIRSEADANIMKVPSIPLEIVYKVVAVKDDGTMWSANHSAQENWTDYFRIVQYKLQHQVFPNTESKALFVFCNYSDALRGLRYYKRIGQQEDTYRILRGYAVNVRRVSRENFQKELKRVSEENYIDNLPIEMDSVTALCDWFMPTDIVI